MRHLYIGAQQTDEAAHLSSSPVLMFSFDFHLYPLELMLLQSASHMYYIGHKTRVLMLCSLRFNFTIALEESSFFMNSHGFLQYNIFSPLHVRPGQAVVGSVEKWRKENKLKEKNIPWLNSIYNICGVVVIELFRTILIDTIKENGVAFRKVLI